MLLSAQSVALLSSTITAISITRAAMIASALGIQSRRAIWIGQKRVTRNSASVNGARKALPTYAVQSSASTLSMVKAACDDRPAGISTSASHSIIDRVRLHNQLESLLEEAHIKLRSLVSDLLGASARRRNALADGETNLRATLEQLCDALGACTARHSARESRWHLPVGFVDLRRLRRRCW